MSWGATGCRPGSWKTVRGIDGRPSERKSFPTSSRQQNLGHSISERLRQRELPTVGSRVPLLRNRLPEGEVGKERREEGGGGRPGRRFQAATRISWGDPCPSKVAPRFSLQVLGRREDAATEISHEFRIKRNSLPYFNEECLRLRGVDSCEYLPKETTDNGRAPPPEWTAIDSLKRKGTTRA